MTSDPSRDLIERLAVELEPVRPLRPLAERFGPVLLVCLALGAAVAVEPGLRGDLASVMLGEGWFMGVLVGLLLAALGGCTAALASVVPGREHATRVGALVAACGVAIGLTVAVAGTPWAEATLAGGWSSHAGCLVRGVALAVLPALVSVWLVSRGWSARPVLTASLALLGAGSAGALLVHLSCPSLDPLHVLAAHVSSPLVLMTLAAAAVASLLRRRAR